MTARPCLALSLHAHTPLAPGCGRDSHSRPSCLKKRLACGRAEEKVPEEQRTLFVQNACCTTYFLPCTTTSHPTTHPHHPTRGCKSFVIPAFPVPSLPSSPALLPRETGSARSACSDGKENGGTLLCPATASTRVSMLSSPTHTCSRNEPSFCFPFVFIFPFAQSARCSAQNLRFCHSHQLWPSLSWVPWLHTEPRPLISQQVSVCSENCDVRQWKSRSFLCKLCKSERQSSKLTRAASNLISEPRSCIHE